MAKRPLRIPDRSKITDDTPLRLDVAAALAFPGGGMTASGLRKERDAGRLATEFIAGKEYVTLEGIKRMRELCTRRIEPRAPDPKRWRPQPVQERTPEMAQAALQLTLERLDREHKAKREAEKAAKRAQDLANRPALLASRAREKARNAECRARTARRIKREAEERS